MAGDEITGASTFLIEEGLDSGPVYGTVTEEIRHTDTASPPKADTRRGPRNRAGSALGAPNFS